MSNQIPIPKFGSFKPKAVSEVDKVDAEVRPRHEESRESWEPRKSREHRREREHRHRNRTRSHERRRSRGRTDDYYRHRSSRDYDRGKHHGGRRSRSRSRERDSGAVVRRPTSPLEPAAPTPIEEKSMPSFIVDRRGDSKNLVYGRLHQYDVPPFRRFGGGSVLGVDRRIKIDRGIAEDVDGLILVNPRKNGNSKREKYIFARNEKKGARLLKVKSEAVTEEDIATNGDFIALNTSKKRKRSNSMSASDSEVERTHYRSIAGKAKPASKPAGEDLAYATDSSSSDAERGRTIKLNDEVRRKNVELSRAVDKNPQDLEAWLSLINHQDAMLGLGEHGRRMITPAEIQSTADIKLDMYQKALRSCGEKQADREKFLLGIMKEGAKVWSPEEQKKRWEKVTKEELQSARLWKRYLDFRVGDFAGFKYEDVLEMFKERLALLREAYGQSSLAEGTREELRQQMVFVLLRVTLLMRNLGYTELSVGVWQANLEFNIFTPPQLPSGTSKLEAFQEFWDSEVPRIGEEKAQSWKHFITHGDGNGDELPETGKDDDNLPKLDSKKDLLGNWGAAEFQRANASKWPARTYDDTVEDDPYRVIMWHDIESFMIDLGAEEHTHRLLVDAFLLFCRLPPSSKDSAARKWLDDPHICGGALDAAGAVFPDFYQVSTARTGASANHEGSTADVAISSTYATPYSISSNAATTDVMFRQSTLLGVMPDFLQPYDETFPLSRDFATRTLQTLVTLSPTDELAEYYLAYLAIISPTTVRKTAETIIASQPTSTKLYNAYALILWNSGKKEKAMGVLKRVLGMQNSMPEAERQNSIVLWRSIVWCHLDDHEPLKALKSLLQVGHTATEADIDVSSPTLRIRAKQYLTDQRDGLVPHRPELASTYAELLSLLAYLLPLANSSTPNRDIEAALTAADSFSASLESYRHPSHYKEAHLQSVARLLYHHATSGSFKPALIRQRMEDAIREFPKNTMFFSLFAWNESRLRIDDRVRTLLRDVVLLPGHDCVSSRLFAINYEITHGNVHSVKAAFEAAVSPEACKGNAGLWRMYVLWCINCGDERMNKAAKDVLFRAMRACPGVKRLCMDAFTDMDRLMEEEDMRKVYRVMREKEVRIHVEMEDWIDEHEEQLRARAGMPK